MPNPFVSNVYGWMPTGIDEPYSFESISYTSPAPQVITLFREPMQAPPFDYSLLTPEISWRQGASLSLLSAKVYLRAAMMAPDPWADVWNYRTAFQPNNLTPLHSAHAGIKFKVIGSPATGDTDGTVTSKITGKSH